MAKTSLQSLKRSFISKVIGKLGTLPIQIDITNGCNLTCVHCYHPDHINKSAMKFHQILNVIDQYESLIQKVGFRPYFIICGGEPLLSKNFLPIIRHLAGRYSDSQISVLTNGTLVTEELIEKIGNIKNIRFQVSLDGFDSESHDSVRGKGSFERALAGIKKLKFAGFTVQTMTVLSKRTSFQIGSYFELGKTYNLDAVCFTRFIPLGAGSKLNESKLDRPLNPSELKRAYQEIVIASGAFNIQTNLHQPLFNLLDSSLGTHSRYGEAVIIDYQGNILLSSRSRFKIGNAFTDGIENIFFNHPILKALRNGEIEGCRDCPHFKKCGGDRNVAFAETGSFLKRDPGCWAAVG